MPGPPMKIAQFLFAIGLLAAPLVWAQSPEHIAEVQRISAIGWDIYEHDQA